MFIIGARVEVESHVQMRCSALLQLHQPMAAQEAWSVANPAQGCLMCYRHGLDQMKRLGNQSTPMTRNGTFTTARGGDGELSKVSMMWKKRNVTVIVSPIVRSDASK